MGEQIHERQFVGGQIDQFDVVRESVGFVVEVDVRLVVLGGDGQRDDVEGAETS